MDSPPTDHPGPAEIVAGKDVHDILDAISRISAESIMGLRTAVEAGSLRRAAELIHRSDSICVSGLDDAFTVATLLATGLAERGCECSVVGPERALEQHRITGHGQNGLLIVVELSDGGLPGDIIEESRSHNVPVLAIGGSADENSADYCDLRLSAPKSPIVHGMPIMAGYVVAAQLLLITLDQYRVAED